MPNSKYIIPDEKNIISKDNILLDKYVVHTVKAKEDERQYLISFKDYKKKKCEIEDIDKSGQLQKTLKWFKTVGLATTKEELPPSSRVDNSGNYSFLYNGLADEDVEVEEFKAGGTARVFYYVDELNKTVNCILIKNAHIELK